MYIRKRLVEKPHKFYLNCLMYPNFGARYGFLYQKIEWSTSAPSEGCVPYLWMLTSLLQFMLLFLTLFFNV